MILSFFTQKSTRSAKLSSVFTERFSGEGQADFAINKAHKVSLKSRNNLYISCVFNGFKYICFKSIYIFIGMLRKASTVQMHLSPKRCTVVITTFLFL